MRKRIAVLALVLAASAFAARAGEAPAIRQVGLCYTGFGVPGSGRPCVFGDLALVNAGEGYPTVCDVSDPREPKAVRYIPTWFFTTFVYPLPSRDLVYMSSSRGPLLVLRGLKSLASQGDVKEIPWERAWGRSFLSGLRPDGIGYTVAGESIFALDLNDPDHPRELRRIPQPRFKPHKMPTFSEDSALSATLVREEYLLTFAEGYRLAAAILDGGKRVALLEWKSPTEPVICGEFDNASVNDGKTIAYGRVLAMDSQRLIIGHPASTSQYWRCFKMTFWDIRDPRQPKRASESTIGFPDTHIRDIALAGDHAYVLDGRNIASGHGVHRTQRSRLIVLDLSNLAAPRIAATWDETMPTEYSQCSLVGSRLYVNDYNYGLRIFDVSNPLKPAKLGGVPTSAEGHWLYLSGDHAFMAHTFGGAIHVINVADPAKPRTVGYYWDGQWLNYMAKIRGKGSAMYLPQFDGLAIVDIAKPARPKRVGEFLDADGQPLAEPCLDLAGDTAFVATAPRSKTPSRLLVYDVAQPLKPQLISATDLPGKRGFRVLAAGKMLYLVGYGGKRLLAIDAADPKGPRITADLNAPEVQVGGRKVSLEIKDRGGNGAPGLAFSRGYLYVTMGNEAPDAPYLLIFDVRDPAAIRPAGALYVRDRKGWQYFACDVIVEGDRLVIGDYGCEEVYDLADPLMPKSLAQYRRSYAWQVGTLRGRFLYVPKLDGLEILGLPQP